MRTLASLTNAGTLPIPRSNSGISSLDEILDGGFPAQRTTVVVGTAGCGKTVLALQYLCNGAALYGEKGLFVTFEETEAAVAINMRSMNWGVGIELDKDVHLLDARARDKTIGAGDYDVGALIAVIEALAKTHAIKRLVLDGIDALFIYATRSGTIATGLSRLLEWLDQSGLTTIITAKNLDDRSVFPPIFQFIEYMAASIIRMEGRFHDRALRRTLAIVKMRGGSFVTGEHSFVIDYAGIDLTRCNPQILEAPLEERRPTGIERLDRMLGGGYRAGTVTLISGLPGTGKSTIAGAFLAANCAKGRRAMMATFEQSADQVAIDLRSVGIEIDPYRESGDLLIVSFITASMGADEHFIKIRTLLEFHKPELLVVDAISALRKSGGRELADEVAEKVSIFCKGTGITLVMTATVETTAGEMAATPTEVSSIADNWLHLSFALQKGERNRTLSIVKARGTAHSNQLRELIFTDAGIVLEDVYATTGEVLLGTARLEREQAQRAEWHEVRLELDDALRELDDRSASLSLDLEHLTRELESVRSKRVAVARKADEISANRRSNLAAILERRRVDPSGTE
jgi:circadian clock protein KaiC